VNSFDILRDTLKKIEIIRLKYSKINENSADEFNIFSILHKDHDEVRLHSRFIGELLDPAGSHGQSDIFCKLFFHEVMGFLPFPESEEIEIHREKFGIDMLLKCGAHVVIIENKIYAIDQPQQLQRYYDRVLEIYGTNTKISILYLTLFGRDPEDKLQGIEQINASYAINVREWVSECIKKVALFPGIRETLNQYLILVLKLTGQSAKGQIAMEIKEILKERGSLQSILSAIPIIVEINKETQINFWRNLRNMLSKKGYDFSFVNNDFSSIEIEEKVSDFVDGKNKSKWFGLAYIFPRIYPLKHEQEVSLYIEFDDVGVYFGITGLEAGKRKHGISNNPDFKKNVRIPIGLPEQANPLVEDWWLYRTFPKNRIHFLRECSSSIVEFQDKAKMNSYVNSLSDEVIALIKAFQR